MQTFLANNPRFASPLHKAPHAYAGCAADIVAEIAPHITKTRWERTRDRVAKLGKRSQAAAKAAPHMVIHVFETAVKEAPSFAARVKEDLLLFRETRKAKKDAARDVAAAAE